MALTYRQQDEQMGNETFIRRVAQGCIAQAQVVMGESVAVGGHELRAAFAQRVLGNPVETGRLVARAVLTNPNCGTGTSDPLVDSTAGDDALLYTIATWWDAYSGYSANQGAASVESKAASVAVPDVAPVAHDAEGGPDGEEMEPGPDASPWHRRLFRRKGED